MISMVKNVFLVLIIYSLASCANACNTKVNNIVLNDSISEREALGFSPNVKSVLIDKQYAKEYVFDKQGNVLERMRQVRNIEWWDFNTYKSGLLVEKISLWTYHQYITYEYNEQRQLIRENVYETVPFFYFDEKGDMLASYDNRRLDLKQMIKDRELKLKTVITYTYNEKGQLIKEEYKKMNFNAMSRSAMYGNSNTRVTTRYSYNKNNQLVKMVETAPGSRVLKDIELYKYNACNQIIYEKSILERSWYNAIFGRENTQYFYTYDNENRLTKMCWYDDNDESEVNVKEYKYDSEGKLYEQWYYWIERKEGGGISIDNKVSDCQRLTRNELGDIEEISLFRVILKKDVTFPESLLDVSSDYFEAEEISYSYKYIYEYF